MLNDMFGAASGSEDTGPGWLIKDPFNLAIKICCKVPKQQKLVNFTIGLQDMTGL